MSELLALKHESDELFNKVNEMLLSGISFEDIPNIIALVNEQLESIVTRVIDVTSSKNENNSEL